jgi:hypothetical protein
MGRFIGREQSSDALRQAPPALSLSGEFSQGPALQEVG